jgi:glycosyltransferase involved in cell wall biosynthesis
MWTTAMTGTDSTHPVEISLLIPVYNGATTIDAVVQEIHTAFRGQRFEVVLVNDGSSDDSEAVCASIADRHPGTVRFLQLARNFGEHNAVLAGLQFVHGDYVVVLDDDGQHPPSEALRLYEAIQRSGEDVVYGHYDVKRHSWLRNAGSRFNDAIATLLLKKPPGLYLSSFKVMNRFLVDQLRNYRGSRPYIDGLIHRTTRRIGQVDVAHRQRAAGRSNYGPRRLVSLWLDMLLSFSILPLRVAGILGLVCSLLSGLLLVGVVIDKLWLNPGVTVGIPTVVITIAFFAGVQLLILGTLGEYLGRLFMDYSGTPLFVIRYVKDSSAEPR